MSESFAHGIDRWLRGNRAVLGVGFLLHLVLSHFYLVGFTSWDGFGHRIPPIVELLQHGRLEPEKFDNWALYGYRPFIELVHAPFLALFGMPGVLLGFATTLFPLCILAVGLFTSELTQDKRAGFYAAFTYALVPFVNAQVESGYIDWAVCGLLAFFLYALLVLARRQDWKAGGLFLLATFVFTMARQQAPYLGTLFFAVLCALLFRKPGTRAGLRFALPAFALGIALPVAIQLKTYAEHGTPIWPLELHLLGIRIGEGYSLQRHPTMFGLPEYTTTAMLKTGLAAWLVPDRWPTAFFDSRSLGVGLFGVAALVTAPLSLRRASNRTRLLLATFVVLGVLAKDLWYPRLAYGMVLGMSVMLGTAFSALLDKPRLHRAYVALVVVAGLHVFRPEWDLFRIRAGDFYARINVGNSSLYTPGLAGELDLYPDVHGELLIVNTPPAQFLLPLYGRRLTNRVLGTVPTSDIGVGCSGLHRFDRPDNHILIVDGGDLTKACARTCVIERAGRCLAYELPRELRARP